MRGALAVRDRKARSRYGSAGCSLTHEQGTNARRPGVIGFGDSNASKLFSEVCQSRAQIYTQIAFAC
jgi:hypothetical protein